MTTQGFVAPRAHLTAAGADALTGSIDELAALRAAS